jgi:type I restriction enzyme R subunit
MSLLLDDLIKQSREEAEAYEEFLKKAEALAKRLHTKQPEEGVPHALHGKPEAIVLFNNLDSLPADSFAYPRDEREKANLALKIDYAIRERAPAGWQDDPDGPRGKQVLNAIYPLLGRDRKATEAVYKIARKQRGYP